MIPQGKSTKQLGFLKNKYVPAPVTSTLQVNLLEDFTNINKNNLFQQTYPKHYSNIHSVNWKKYVHWEKSQINQIRDVE